MITFKKIDRRYKGGSIYRYMVFITDTVDTTNRSKKIKMFNEIRQWCQDTWGPSYELHDAWALNRDEDWPLWTAYNDHWPLWTWANDSKDEKRVIYLKTDKEYVLAKLRWE